ncbi:two-component system regulatory protein YycI [Peptoniphilus equinus]|uniref:Two-component system regulatory protein YycI n=1 Tax=Peptoniphilus equinus TaxID=3016343 RepID=A0ABY7QVE7_9FIRM|nr:two-component system regulatory protein YycI [Peptoniphilus equinus]WBW50054.1 two-component system regulatory protein YycI [Peptoniphilus equinus]
MDWSQAKKILILALLVTNLILGGTLLWHHIRDKDPTLSDDFIQEVTTRLAAKGIEVRADIPHREIELPSLKVELQNYNPQTLNAEFFDGKGTVDRPNSSFTQISHGDDILSLVNRRRVIYEHIGTLTPSEGDPEAVAKAFLLDHNFTTQDMMLTYTSENDGITTLHYAKVYNGILLERSFTNLTVQDGHVIAMDRLWLDVLNESQSAVTLKSATRALLELMGSDDPPVGAIVRIDPCYYFDPEEQGYIEDITKTSEGRATPYWRFQLENGDTVTIQSTR